MPKTTRTPDSSHSSSPDEVFLWESRRSPPVGVASPVVHIGYALPRAGLPAAVSFRRWVAAALAGARRRKPAELSIRIVDSDEGRALNHRYRGKDYATNVLSFQAELPPGIDLPLLGDLVICAPVVAREAADQRKAVRDHYAHMTVHGVLHLLGHDHMEDAEAERMESLERRILAKLDIPDPYTQSPKPAAAAKAM